MNNIRLPLLCLVLFMLSTVDCYNQDRLIRDSIETLIQNTTDPVDKLKLYSSGIKELKFDSRADFDFYFNKANKLIESVDQPELHMQLLNNAGIKLIGLKERESAKEMFDRLESVSLKVNDLLYQARAKIGFSKLFLAENKLEEAESNLLSSVELAHQADAFMVKANALTKLAHVYRIQGKPKDAIFALDQSEVAFQEEMDIPTYLESLNLKGRIYRSISKLDSAKFYYTKAMQIAKKEKVDESLSRAYNNLGNVEQLEGNFENAISYYVKSLKIKEAQNNIKGIALAHYNIGTIKATMKDYFGSIENFRKSQKMAEEIDYARIIQLSKLQIGNSFNELSQIDSAIIYHNQSLEMAQSAKDKNAIALCYLNLGQDYSALNDFSKAFNYLEDALNIAKETGNVSYESGAYSLIANAYLKFGKKSEEEVQMLENIKLNDQQVKSYLIRAKEIALETGNYETLEISLQGLSIWYNRTKNYKDRAATLDEYISLKDTLFNSERTKAISEWETKYETSEKEKEIANLEAAEERSRARVRLWTITSLLLFVILGLGSYLFVQLRKAKSKLIAQNNQLVELNQTKDRFFGIIAHDIRSPIVALESVDDQMEYYLKKEKTEKLTELGGLVGKTARHLNSLLDNLLNWALVQTNSMSYNPEKINVSDTVQEINELVASNLKMKNITLEKDIPKDLSIKADSPSFNTILRNLLSNAIKFSHPDSKILISAEQSNKRTVFSVKDQGVGINEDKIASLFTLNKKSEKGTAGEKGTGLGLILCKELVELNQGEISVRSELGKGTTFKFTIPNAL